MTSIALSARRLRAGAWARGHAVSLALAATMLVGALATGSLLTGPRGTLSDWIGTGAEAFAQTHNFLGPLTAAFFAPGPLVLLAALVATVLVVGEAERLMGPWRTLAAFVVTAYASAGIGTLLQSLGLLAHERWSVRIQEYVVTDPFTAIIGTVMTASAFMGTLWRRRVRILGLSAVVIVLLYAGHPSDLFRLIAALLGLVLGALIAREKPTLRVARSSHREARSLVSVVLLVTAVGPVVSVFSPHGYGLLQPLGVLFRNTLPSLAPLQRACAVPSPALHCAADLALARINGPGAVILAPLPLVVLALAAIGMLRGRRSAALVAIAVNVLLAAMAAFYYGFVPAFGESTVLSQSAGSVEGVVRLSIAVAVPLVVAAVILATLRHFTVRTSATRAVRYVAVVGGSFLALAGTFLAVGMLARAQFAPVATPASLLLELPDRFVPVGFLRLEAIDLLPSGPLALAVYDAVGPLFWLIVVAATAWLIVATPDAVASAELERVRALLRHGSGSLGHLATWRGNRYWFSADGAVAIAYRVHSGCAVSVSDPIGPAEQWEAAARAFVDFCDDRGWDALFYSVHDDFVPIAHAMGWATTRVGTETIVRPASLTLQGRSWQDVRSSINRAERAGIRFLWTRHAELPPALALQIDEISESWVAEKDLPELGFTLGGTDELRDPEVALGLAIDAGGQVEAVTSWMPRYRDGRVVGWTLDFMRRRPDSINGVMEFLIASSALQMRDDGIEELSLSAAPLVAPEGEDALDRADGAPAPQRVLALLARALEPAYGFRSLFAFKRKFSPSYAPLHLAYRDALVLPAAGAALARAYLPSAGVRDALQVARALL